MFDIDFSNDEPTINAQLAKEGFRKAHSWERGWFVTCQEFGRIVKVWATDKDEPIAPEPPRFSSYREAKARSL